MPSEKSPKTFEGDSGEIFALVDTKAALNITKK
jgi:hypothetical protein